MYDYSKQRAELFTDEGQRLFVKVRDQVRALLDHAGATTVGRATRLPDGIGAADSWDLLACVHRMEELGEIVIIERPHHMTQDAIVVPK